MAIKIHKLFGAIVRRRREELGRSQEAVANKADLHRNYIGLLERGLRTPSIEVVRKLAVGLDTTMTALVQELEAAMTAKAAVKKGGAKGRGS